MTKEELIKNQFPNDEFLQAGVLQIVDKCVAELEKENTELKTKKIPQLERKIASIRGAHSVDCKKLNARTEQVDRLKKENAELKEKLYGSRLYAVNEKLNADILLLEKLNKEQKEHIKTLEEANKANEWHYVKDELPISDKDRFYFVVDKWNLPMIARFYEEVWSNLTVIDDVIAWKEIVLPELKDDE